MRHTLLFLLLFLASPAWAAITYVSNTGQNGNPCGAPITTPRQTLDAGLACLGAGDTLYIRQGTYPEGINSNTMTMPVGTSWSIPVTIAAYPGETVIVVGVGVSSPAQYLILDRLIIDGGVWIGNGGHHIRIQNGEVRNAPQFGVLIAQTGGGFNELLALNIHHNGVDTQFEHGVYVSGSPNNLIDGCQVHDNASYGIHLYNNDGAHRNNNNIIRNTRIYNNRAGLLLGFGDGNSAYNNIIYNNQSGMSVGFSTSNNLVYNNTLYNNTQSGYASMEIDSSATGTVVRNNIVYVPGTINDIGISTILSNNLFTDPSFANAGGGDFQLTAASTAAINAGTTISAVLTDIAGVSRPQGAGYDIGAYEFTSGGGPAPGLQALRWKMDEGSGTTTADATGNGYTGTLVAAPTWGPGRVGAGAVAFDGATQYVKTDSLIWAAGQSVTVAFWRKVTTCTASGLFGARGVTGQRFGAHVPYADCILYFDYGDWQTSGRISVNYTPYLTRWTRVVLVSTPGFKGIYLNGALVASGTTAGAPTVALTGLDVGRWALESETLYDSGWVDNFSIENRAWTAAEILTDYRQQALPHRRRMAMR